MSGKVNWTLTLASIVVIVLTLFVITPAEAVDGPAHDAGGAGAPLVGWVELAPKEAHWYRFHYNFDNTKEDATPTEALVVLKAANESRGVEFSVETMANLARPKEDEDGRLRGPVGVGAPLSLQVHRHDAPKKDIERDLKNADEHGMIQNWKTLIWSTANEADEDFYVIVKNTSTQPQVYQLSIIGPEVSFPQ